MKTPWEYARYARQEKRRYKEMQSRVNTLPENYQFVYHKIEHYMWMHADGNGMQMVPLLADLLDLFETSAAEGKKVLDVTGEDVAAFCDELLRGVRQWTENWHDALNRDIQKKLNKKGDPR
ncbi:MAG: DUF1048 domain-containing protein [Oscillospiraceae bacterium]|nr:DUF1048 domain-containing protein [Oscillospiraceae bacterium]